MPEPFKHRLDIGRLRRELDGDLCIFHDENARLTQLKRQLELFGGADPDLEQQIEDLSAFIENTEAPKLERAKEALATALSDYESAVAAEPPVWRRGGDLPLLLLPVRLEAVHRRDVSPAQLLLRVYPDDVHVDAHEEGLTPAEREAATRYWKAVRAPGVKPAGRAAAWTALLERLGPARATWALEALRPGAPRPKSRADSWTRAAHTTLLPDRFVFSAYVSAGDTELELAWRHEGRDIPDTLKVGFPPPDQAGERLEGLPWDEESAWLVKFEEAVDKGMALAVDLPDPDVFYDLITVVGVSTGITPKASADRWQAALLAHQHGDGLAFVPTRTPTNNTPGSRSGWMSRPELRMPDEIDRLRRRHKPGSPQAAARAARAFGIDGQPVLSATPGALAEEEGPELKRLHKALGLLINRSDLLRPYPLPSEDPNVPDTTVPAKVPRLLAHFTDHVRSRGTLPALRIGRQPYGVLPASSLDLWKGDEPDPRLIDHLKAVASRLEQFVLFAPRVGLGGDEDSVILDLLSRVPASERMKNTQSRPVDVGQTLADEPPKAVVGTVPKGSRAEYFNPPEDATPPRDIEAMPRPEVRDVLATAPLKKLLDVADGRLARLSEARFGNHVLESLDQAQQDVLFPIVDSGGGRGFYRIAVAVFANLEIDTSFSQRALADPDFMSADERAQLDDSIKRGRELAAALVALEPRAAQDLPGLDRLLLEALDTVGHRVDAWITSLANMRLEALRERHPVGLRTGAYGWLLEVHDPQTEVGSDGYILTPSLQHASTAAVLRSGWQAHEDKQALAVDLQSWRVRAALELIDGIRTGQPLGALLGYRFERGLHEAGMEVFISGFRRAFPLPRPVGADGTPEPPRAASIEARNVVDGQRLRRNLKEPDAPDPRDNADAVKPGAGAVIARLIAELEEMVDAVGDLLLAESVHHLVGGNPLRAGLSADAVGRGDGLPQDFEVIRTPRSATAITHHVGLLGPPGGAPGPGGWNDGRALAKLEPAIEAWCRQRLGAASGWRFGLRDGDVPDVGLDALGWCALEVVSASRVGVDGSPLLGVLRSAAGGELDDTGEARLRELGLVCEQLRTALAVATPLLAGHLNPEVKDTWAHADLRELGTRVRPWLAAVIRAGETLRTRLAATPPNPALIRRSLNALADLGVVAALPPENADVAGHAAQVVALLDAARLEPLPGLPADEAKVDVWARGAMLAISTVLGDHAKVVPVLRMPLPDRRPEDATPDLVADWLRGVTPVRPGAAALDQALVGAKVIGGGADGELTVLQMPFEAGDGWVAQSPALQGDPSPPGEDPRPAIRSTAVLHHDGPPGGAVAGLVVDSWAEAVPRPGGEHGPEEIAGLAFHYNRPGARAPQSLLLAVPPNVERGWRMEDIHAVVDQTFRLTRMRCLDLRDVAPEDPTEPNLRRLLPLPDPF